MPTQTISWLAVICGAAFALGLVATFTTRGIARRIGFVAKPRAERWHSRPTALAGGVGIFVGFLVPALVVGGPLRLHLLLGATAMFTLGFVDDIVHLKPYAKLIGQFVIATLTVITGSTLPWTSILIVNQAVSLFWIIGITNALNLLDNMDGLAGGVACVAAIFQALFFVLQHQLPQAACAAALGGGILGFLVFNWNPASIFMGDSGALFLGYTLGSLAMESGYGRSRGLLATIAVPVLVMLVPIFDTTFVTLVRLVRGRPVSQGGRDHTSHRLVILGLSEKTAVRTLIVLGILGGAISLLAREQLMSGVWLAAPILGVTLAFLGLHLARTDRPIEDEAHPHRNVLLSLAAFGYKRRFFEVFVDAILAMVALISAFLLRFDGAIPANIEGGLARVFLIVVATKLVVMFFTNAYDGVWRYAGLRDLVRLSRSALLGSLCSFVLIGLWLRFGMLSRGALIIDGLLFAVFVVASRISFRFLRMVLGGRHEPSATGVRVLLWGAGDVGEQIARRLLENVEEGFVPVGFIDDDPLKFGRVIHGLAVQGDGPSIPGLLEEGRADVVIITSPRISAERIGNVVERVGRSKVRRVRFVLEEIPMPITLQAPNVPAGPELGA